MTNFENLLVIIPDRLSDLLRKGEITDRYYNPGNLFRNVHILMVNDDSPDKTALQRMVGTAQLNFCNLPAGKSVFARSLGWRPWLLGGWAMSAVAIAREISPQLVRCHGVALNALAAYHIKRELGIPYVVSMHTNPATDMRGRARGIKEKLIAQALPAIEKLTLRNADLVMPVYQGIVPYLNSLGGVKYEVCYNALNGSTLSIKNDYTLHCPIQVLSVGRQLRSKNPDNLIRAVAQIPTVHLTLIGDGELHEALIGLAEACGVSNRVTFVKALDNPTLCAQLEKFDLFAVHNDYLGIPKAVMEPMLAGLPIVANRRQPESIAEMDPNVCLLVDNTVEGYREALERIVNDTDLRERAGRAAREYATQRWDPVVAEEKFMNIYKRIVAEAARS